MAKKKTAGSRIYKIIFLNQGKVYEVYAKQVSQGALFGFVEVEHLLFGERTKVVVDPSEESLKTEFAGVKRFYIPMHAVVRIDVVEKQGSPRITSSEEEGGTISTFPVPVYTPGKDPGIS